MVVLFWWYLKRPEVASLQYDFAAVQGALSGGAWMVALESELFIITSGIWP
ncbi:hypothetical protein NFC73_17125 [Pseudarthrobacter sp. RMG13]|uniref:Uncharacterized protein n=1 Tax=Pseudarthrobacter humi TaxID=2952523 RepID=A0ABT1LWA3_9MICC|nr:hypothetical protein [Pseudarthrobacter humi]MCP9001436.1 hypothetical protein [Pseudarthrobacter humi]